MVNPRKMGKPEVAVAAGLEMRGHRRGSAARTGLPKEREREKEWVGGAGPGGRRGWGLQVTANPRRLLRSVGVAGGWCRGLGLGAPALGCCRVQSSLLALSF